MHKYFIIFPHAGAIRSSYAYIEKSLREDVEVIYVEYDLCATNIGSFEEFLDSAEYDELLTDEDDDGQ